MSDQILEIIKEERTALHDMANQVTIVQGMVGIAEKKLGKDDLDKDAIIEKLEKALNASSRLITIIKERRANLILRQEKLEN